MVTSFVVCPDDPPDRPSGGKAAAKRPARRRRRDFAFLCCVSNDERLDRLKASIDELERPPDTRVEVFTRRGVRHLAEGYNALMREAAEWRYKIYVHEDVAILNRRLLDDVTELFRDRRVGMIGPAGCRYLPESCIWWDGSGVVGRVLELHPSGPRLLELDQPAGPFEVVEAADGLCLITQHDLPWDETMAPFHFYDVAQCTRFTLAGYDVVVPRQPEPWFSHVKTVRDEAAWEEVYAARDLYRDRYAEARARFARRRVRRRVSRALRRLPGVRVG